MEIFSQTVQMKGNISKENTMTCNFFYLSNILTIQKHQVLINKDISFSVCLGYALSFCCTHFCFIASIYMSKVNNT